MKNLPEILIVLICIGYLVRLSYRNYKETEEKIYDIPAKIIPKLKRLKGKNIFKKRRNK